MLVTHGVPSGRENTRVHGTPLVRSARFQTHVLYKLRNKSHRSGRYSLALEQAMSVQQLEGIIDVGVSVERSEGG